MRQRSTATRGLSLTTLAAVLLCATEVILIVCVGVGGGAGITAHGALPLPLQDTCLEKPQGCRKDESRKELNNFISLTTYKRLHVSVAFQIRFPQMLPTQDSSCFILHKHSTGDMAKGCKGAFQEYPPRFCSRIVTSSHQGST